VRTVGSTTFKLKLPELKGSCNFAKEETATDRVSPHNFNCSFFSGGSERAVFSPFLPQKTAFLTTRTENLVKRIAKNRS
jgi:hypothetical protein